MSAKPVSAPQPPVLPVALGCDNRLCAKGGELSAFDPRQRHPERHPDLYPRSLQLFDKNEPVPPFGISFGPFQVTEAGVGLVGPNETKEHKALGGVKADVEAGLVAHMAASVSAIASGSVLIGEPVAGAMLHAGTGLKGQVGLGELFNVYCAVLGTANAGLGLMGATAGVGVRYVAGAEFGFLFVEGAADRATNLQLDTLSVGLRFHKNGLL